MYVCDIACDDNGNEYVVYLQDYPINLIYCTKREYVIDLSTNLTQPVTEVSTHHYKLYLGVF